MAIRDDLEAKLSAVIAEQRRLHGVRKKLEEAIEYLDEHRANYDPAARELKDTEYRAVIAAALRGE